MKRITMFVLLVLAVISMASCAEVPFSPVDYEFEASEVSSITVGLRDRRIELSASSDGKVHISALESVKEGYSVTLASGGDLRMEMDYDKEWTDFFGTKPAASDRLVTIALPDVVLESLTLSTTNGGHRAGWSA